MAEQSYRLHDFRRKEKISKKLSFALSKGSADLGLHMDHEGWIDLDLLIAAWHRHGFSMVVEEVLEALHNNPLFQLDDAARRVKAGADPLSRLPQVPPKMLYHGTSTVYLGKILSQGILKGDNDTVYMYESYGEAARHAGQFERGIVLEVASLKMEDDGYDFYKVEGSWLSERIPPEYLAITHTQI